MECFSELSLKVQPVLISIIEHPNGLEFINNDHGKMTGVAASDLIGYQILFFDQQDNELHLMPKIGEPYVFNFREQDASSIMTFLRTTNTKQIKEERTPSQIKEDLESLQEAFVAPPDFSASFRQDIKTGMIGKTKELEITNDFVRWADETVTISDATGYSFGRTKTRTEGIKTAMTYEIFIHSDAKKSLKIGFGRPFGVNEGQAE
ncbi:MAG: hypothetical protein ACI837_002172 [Crocinitomicaceae bacterium]|jgi:hypothetical protein